MYWCYALASQPETQSECRSRGQWTAYDVRRIISIVNTKTGLSEERVRHATQLYLLQAALNLCMKVIHIWGVIHS